MSDNVVVGILKITDTAKFDTLISDLSVEPGYSCIDIQLEKQLEKIEVLIILANQREDYIEVCRWLIIIASKKPIFIWIICQNDEENISELYSELAKNSIVSIVDMNICNEFLFFQVKKAAKYIKNVLTFQKDQAPQAQFLLDKKSMKFILDDNEIELTRNEFKMMSILHNAMGNVVSYRELIKGMWSVNDDVSYKYRLANLVFHVRKKLKKQSYIDIKIVRTRGYKLGLKGEIDS